MTVDIISYGADPTGVNDSTQAIMNALASGASHVIAPAGTYKVSSIDFSSWGIPLNPSKPYFFDAASAIFVHNASSTDFAMINLYAGPTNALLRCKFEFGFLLAEDNNVQCILFIKQFCNSRIECAFIGQPSGTPNAATGVFVDQTGNPPFGTFNNIIEIQDIAGCANGFTIYADLISSHNNGFEGNLVTIGRLGFNSTNGLSLGQITNARVLFNTFFMGPIEHNTNGYGVYERGGGNQFYINNLNNNNQNNNNKGIGAISGLTNKSLFIASNQDSIDPSITQEHFYTNVYVKTTNW
jgi:hypothetical protein